MQAKITLLASFLLFTSSLLSAQDLNWVKGIGSDHFLGDAVRDMALDQEGNLYITGRFSGTMDFDPGPDSAMISAASGWDGFIAKYDIQGNFIWALDMASSDGGQSFAIAIDDLGAVYVAGHFLGACDFDLTSNDGYLTTNGAGRDIFLAKYDTDGDYLWAMNLGGTSYDEAHDILLDENNNVYLTGFFRGECDFDPGPGDASIYTNGINDIFLAKYSSDGNYLWAKHMGGTAADEANAIARDDAGNIYLCGRFFSTADFDPGPGVTELTSNGVWDSFIAKYDAEGNFIWVKSLGGSEIDDAISIAIDQQNNIVCSGFFNETIDLNTGIEADSVSSNGSTDIYFLKLDNDGNYLWGKTIGGGFLDLAKSLALDPGGNIYLTGFYNWTVDFDPDPFQSHLNDAHIGQDIFVAKYNPDGQYIWAKSIRGEGGDDEGNILIAPSTDRFYIGGEFFKTADFDLLSEEVESTSHGAGDLFFGQYGPCYNLNLIDNICAGESYTFPDGLTTDQAMTHLSVLTTTEGCDSLVTIQLSVDSFNTSVQQMDNILSAENQSGSSYQWLDCDENYAWIEGATSSTFKADENGNYAVLITEGTCSDTSSCFSVIGLNTPERLSEFPNISVPKPFS